MASVPIKQKNTIFRKQLQRQREEHVKIQAEIEVMQPRIKDGQEPPKPGEGKNDPLLETWPALFFWALDLRTE